MKWLLYFLLTIALVTVLTLYAIEDRGYVLIHIWNYTIESTLVTWLVVVAMAFFITHYTLRIVGQFFQAPREVKKWRGQRRQHAANQSLLKGLVKLAEGNWRDAEKAVLKNVHNSQIPMLNYLAAARAAHEQNEFDRRDRYINLAGQHAEASDLGVKLTQAELQMGQHRQEQALATLRVLQQADPHHSTVIKILAQLYQEMGDWSNLINLLPALRKQKIFKTEDLNQLEHNAYIQLLKVNGGDHKSALTDIWYRMPQSAQNNNEVLTTYVNQLLLHGQSDIAEPLLRNAIKREWNNSLVRFYGIIHCADAAMQLRHAETWLQQQDNNPALLLTLGRLSLRNQLWGKARGYLEASISAGGSAEAYNELAHLLESMGEKDLAVNYYREGLSKAPLCEYSIALQSHIEESARHKPEPPALLSAGSKGMQ